MGLMGSEVKHGGVVRYGEGKYMRKNLGWGVEAKDQVWGGEVV